MFRILRKKSKLFNFILIFVIILITSSAYFLLYNDIDKQYSTIDNDLRISNEIQRRLNALEDDLRENRSILDSVRFKMEELTKTLNRRNYLAKNRHTFNCSAKSGPGDVTWSIEDVYKRNSFENTDGGVWKQGWEIKLNESRFTGNDKLRVIIVPHSHNDPGWLKTFDQYLNDFTRHILNNMLSKLTSNSRLSFIWAEVSFFAHWWAKLESEDDREAVKNLLDNGQLEIVTGGWVMNDEANTHYSAMIGQMIDGHEWLRNNLGYKPRHGWAIDPFGLSPTMAYLLKRMGFKGMVIQRVHYSLKKYLAQNRLLEFAWRQQWEKYDDFSINDINAAKFTHKNSDDDIICHVEPFFSYDIPHTCGPDPKICCQFDFKRLHPTRVHCPWKIPPQRITKENVAVKSRILLDQYRKKAMLYRTNTLLVPLGDDFRYDKLIEWENQFKNYQMIIDYLNSQPELNVEILLEPNTLMEKTGFIFI